MGVHRQSRWFTILITILLSVLIFISVIVSSNGSSNGGVVFLSIVLIGLGVSICQSQSWAAISMGVLYVIGALSRLASYFLVRDQQTQFGVLLIFFFIFCAFCCFKGAGQARRYRKWIKDYNILQPSR